MRLLTHTDIESAAIALLRGLPESDILIILREAGTGSEERLREVVTALVLHELNAAGAVVVPVPDDLSPEEQAAWKATVAQAAVELVKGRLLVLDEVLPLFMRQRDRAAEAAGAQVDVVRGACSGVYAQLDASVERSDLHSAKSARPHALLLERRRWAVVAVGLGLFEALGVFAICAMHFGVLDYPSLASVPGQVWAQVLAVGAFAVLTSMGLAYAAFHALLRHVGGARFEYWYPRLVVVGLVVFAIAFGLFRWAGTEGAVELSDGMSVVGAIAQVVTFTIGSVALALAAVYAHHKYVQVRARHEQAEGEAEGFAAEQRRLRARRDDLDRHLAVLETQVSAPDRLRTCFESGVRLVAGKLMADQAVVDGRVAQAVSAFRYLQKLSEPKREALATELYELRRVGGPDSRGSSGNGVGGVMAIFLAIAGASVSSGCDAPPAEHLIIVCDGTGSRPDDVCTTEFLQRACRAWSEQAAGSPGSICQVVTTSGSYSATKVHPPIVVPEKWEGGIRAGKPRWLRQALVSIKDIDIPTGTERNCRIVETKVPYETTSRRWSYCEERYITVKTTEYRLQRGERCEGELQSDLVSALLVAGERVAELPDGHADLLVASDGWLTSGHFDAAARVPTSEEVLAYLEKSGVKLTLSGFDDVSVCGFHNDGATATTSQARTALWRGLLKAGGAQPLVVRRSCTNFFPPVPKALRDTGSVGESEGGEE